MTNDLWEQVQTPSAYGPTSATDPGWDRWTSNKHLLAVLGSSLQRVSETQSARANAQSAIDQLATAVQLHTQIANLAIEVVDGANRYQANWVRALNDLLEKNQDDFDYLEIFGK